MSEFQTTEERDAYVMRLHRLKWNHRSIGQALELSKATVTRIISAHKDAPAQKRSVA